MPKKISPRPQDVHSTVQKDAVAMVCKGETVTEVAASLGIARSLLRYWQRQLDGESDQAFPGKGNASTETEQLRELKKQPKDVTEERDILKKHWPTLRTTRSEVPVRPRAPRDSPGRQDVRGPEGLPQRLLCSAEVSAQPKSP